MRILILSRALSTWPRFTHTESWNVHNILLKYRSNMREVTVVLSTCHSNPNGFLLFIFPLGFSLLQTTATRPATLTAKSRLCSEICMLPRKLEVRQPSLQQGAGLLMEKTVAKAFGWFIFFCCCCFNTHMYFKVYSGYLTHMGKLSCKERQSILLCINSTWVNLRAQAEGQLICLAEKDT